MGDNQAAVYGIALNDPAAVGCRAAARAAGIRMPEELSVVGCGRLFCGPRPVPALTGLDTRLRQTWARRWKC